MNNNYSLSENGFKVLVHFEGIRLKPYYCSAGKATIGIGSTYYEDGTPVKITDKSITLDMAYSILKTTSSNYHKAIIYAIDVELSQNQYDALFCLAYNLGHIPTSLSTLINKNPKDKKIWGTFLLYDNVSASNDKKDNDNDGLIDEKGETKEELGLIRRRNSEAHLYFLNEVDFYEKLIK